MKTNERKAVGHTAGEWEAKPYLRPDLDDDPMGVYELNIRDAMEQRFNNAEPESDELDAIHAENQANALLISQAPAMLEALSDLVETMERIGPPAITQGGLCEETDWHYDLRKARAIIARAKGVQ